MCYLRENGPIAYELPLFAPEPRPAVEAMLETGLAWYWRPEGADAAGEWTHLSRWSLAAYLGDLERGGVLTTGVDAADAPPNAVDAIVAGWLRGFASEGASPAHVVVQHRPPADRLFVAQQPIEPVRELLQAWGIDRAKATRRAYARLRGETLEDTIRMLGKR